jgi:hypothetical protein
MNPPISIVFTIAAALLILGCSHTRSSHAAETDGDEGVGGWKRQRSELLNQILASPKESIAPAVRIVNMSTRPDIRGDENSEHGEILYKLKNALGEDWEKVLDRANSRARRNSLVLLEAKESGGIFVDSSPDAIFVPDEEQSRGSISVDLRDTPFP